VTSHFVGHEKCLFLFTSHVSSCSRFFPRLPPPSNHHNSIPCFYYRYRVAMPRHTWSVIVSEEMQLIRQQLSLIWENICSANVAFQFTTSPWQLQSKRLHFSRFCDVLLCYRLFLRRPSSLPNNINHLANLIVSDKAERRRITTMMMIKAMSFIVLMTTIGVLAFPLLPASS
jgi:hypothetical protein